MICTVGRQLDARLPGHAVVALTLNPASLEPQPNRTGFPHAAGCDTPFPYLSGQNCRIPFPTIIREKPTWPIEYQEIASHADRQPAASRTYPAKGVHRHHVGMSSTTSILLLVPTRLHPRGIDPEDRKAPCMLSARHTTTGGLHPVPSV